MDDTKNQDNQDHYLLLGVPRSGKTTYFCSIAEHLQKLAISSGRFGFKFCDNHTSRFINKQMKLLRNDDWPEKTPKKDKEDYRFQLDYEKKILGIKFYTEIVDISYHDYPGEAFSEFCSDDPSGRYDDDIKDLESKTASAKGIFLMLDVEEIFNQKNVEESQEALVALIQKLKKNKKIKLALIFNKIELIPNYSHDKYMKKFKSLYGNAYQWLRGVEHKFFSVYTLGGECRIRHDGEIIPPKELHPKSILKPVNWMIHFI